MIPADPGARRIALILHDFAAGGSERIAIRLANRWAQAGRKVTILCGTDAGPARAEVDEDIEVRVASPPVPRGILSRFRLGVALARMLPEIGADVVVGPGNFHVPVLWSLGRRLGDAAPPMVNKISNPLRRARRGRLRQALFGLWYRLATRDCTELVAMGPALARDARNVTRRKHVSCIGEPNIADTWRAPMRTASSGMILCAGRLEPQKNFSLALRALAALGGPWRLEVLGDGKQRRRLEAAAWRLGIAHRVTFRGHVADVTPFFARADVLLCTSRYEGSPAVLIEALAAGTPVVTTDCTPALEEILVHPSFGRIAAATPAGLADALRKVLAGVGPDADALEQLTRRHRTAHSAAAWLDLLDRLTEPKPMDPLADDAGRRRTPFRTPAGPRRRAA